MSNDCTTLPMFLHPSINLGIQLHNFVKLNTSFKRQQKQQAFQQLNLVFTSNKLKFTPMKAGTWVFKYERKLFRGKN